MATPENGLRRLGVTRARFAPLAMLACGIGLLALPLAVRMPTRLIWNASASVPIGMYAVSPVAPLRIGDLVSVAAPPELERLLVERRYLGTGVPMLKHVAALGGDTVCRRGKMVSIDGVTIAKALRNDRLGRSLPIWRGCILLARDQVFLLNSAESSSFDGRYFGPLPIGTITGRARPVLVRTGRR